MKTSSINRRKFIWGISGSVGLSTWLNRAIAQEQGMVDPRRLVVLQRPVGTIYQHWWPQGSGTNLSNYQFPRILAPLNTFKQDMVVFRGLGLPHGGSSGGRSSRSSMPGAPGRRSSGPTPR